MEWRPVVGYEGLYEVSEFGDIKSYRRYREGKHKKPTPSHNGYLRISLWRNKHRISVNLHRLIYVAFNGLIPEGMEINHINGIKTDNRLENLECVTHQENIRHAYDTGLASQSGERNNSSILTRQIILEIRDRYRNESISQEALGRDYGITQSHVSLILSGKLWKDAE